MSDINNKSREDLKGYFLRDTIPTEENFAALIDAAIIQGEDPIAIVPDTSLMIKTAGATTARQELIRFYNDFDADPSWILGQNPVGGAEGLEIATPDSTQLFISTDGNVGFGTTNPGAKLEVAGDIKTTGTFNNGNLTINASGITTATGTLALQGTDGIDLNDTMLINESDGVKIGQDGAPCNLNLWGDMMVNGTLVNFNQQANNNQIVRFQYYLFEFNGESNNDRKEETYTFTFDDIDDIYDYAPVLMGWKLDYPNAGKGRHFNVGYARILNRDISPNNNQVTVTIECHIQGYDKHDWKGEAQMFVIAVGNPAAP